MIEAPSIPEKKNAMRHRRSNSTDCSPASNSVDFGQWSASLAMHQQFDILYRIWYIDIYCCRDRLTDPWTILTLNCIDIYMILRYLAIYSKNKPSHCTPTGRSGNSPSRAWRMTRAGLQSRSSPQGLGRRCIRHVAWLSWSELGPDYVKSYGTYMVR